MANIQSNFAIAITSMVIVCIILTGKTKNRTAKTNKLTRFRGSKTVTFIGPEVTFVKCLLTIEPM